MFGDFLNEDFKNNLFSVQKYARNIRGPTTVEFCSSRSKFVRRFAFLTDTSGRHV